MTRPRIRWPHSQKKMVWNWPSVMVGNSSAYCGICLYFSNSTNHAASDSGGRMPVITFHSVIDRPDSVSRVAPPTITIKKTSAVTLHSQRRTPRSVSMPCPAALSVPPNAATLPMLVMRSLVLVTPPH